MMPTPKAHSIPASAITMGAMIKQPSSDFILIGAHPIHGGVETCILYVGACIHKPLAHAGFSCDYMWTPSAGVHAAVAIHLGMHKLHSLLYSSRCISWSCVTQQQT
jgi:hypothetical protein